MDLYYRSIVWENSKYWYYKPNEHHLPLIHSLCLPLCPAAVWHVFFLLQIRRSWALKQTHTRVNTAVLSVAFIRVNVATALKYFLQLEQRLRKSWTQSSKAHNPVRFSVLPAFTKTTGNPKKLGFYPVGQKPRQAFCLCRTGWMGWWIISFFCIFPGNCEQ